MDAQPEKCSKLRLFYFRLFLTTLVFSFLATFAVTAQTETAQPILLTESGVSTRALAANARKWTGALPVKSTQVFYPGENSRAVLFAANLELLPEENADAFRLFAEDAAGNVYRFYVETIEQLKNQPQIYALTIKLADENNRSLAANGDVLLRLSWRGVASNSVRLGLGATGGKFENEKDLFPAPAPLFPASKTSLSSAKTTTEGDRQRFIEQATFGYTPELDLRLRQIGLARWIREQAAKPYPSIPYPNLPLKSGNKNIGCPTSLPENQRFRCELDHYSPYMIQRWLFTDALYGDAQLRRKASWALSKVWVVSANKMEQARWHLEYLKILDKHAFGNYRDLMGEMTLNPAMGAYLDMMQSTRSSPNENYPREILQLFSIGLDELNPNGTPKLNNGNRIPTYDQAKLLEFTKVFTGWTICNQASAACPNAQPGIPNYVDPMVLTLGVTQPSAANPGNHDISAKNLFNYPGAPYSQIPSCANCTDGASDLEDIKAYATESLNKTLDNIYNHPNVAPFVSKRLIQHLVTGDPSPAYVARVANVFNENRTNPQQMLEVFSAILLDPEARGSLKNAPEYGKLREPFQFATNFLRAFGVKSANPAASCQNRTDGYISPQVVPMGQEVLSPPSVFSYYSPEYVLPGTNVVAPEFGIFDTETTFHRSNFVHLLTYAYIFYQENDPFAVVPCGTAINLNEARNWAAADSSANTLIENLNRRLMHGAMSDAMKSDVREAVLTISAADPLARAKQAIYLVATSSQFQVQK